MATGRGILFGIVGMVLLLSGTVSAEPKSVFLTLISEIQVCLQEENVPPVQHDDLYTRAILTTIQNNGTFVRVMQCVGRKVQTFDQNSSVSKQFLHKYFDPSVASKLSSEAVMMYYAVQPADWACLKLSSGVSALKDCLPDLLAGQIMNDFQQVCTTLLPSTALNCASSNSSCTTDVKRTLHIFMYVMFGRCATTLVSPQTTHTSIVTARPSTPDQAYPYRTLNDTPLATCLHNNMTQQLNISLYFIFPPIPSESGAKLIRQNLTYFKNMHKQAMAAFCQNVVAYSNCVEKALRTDHTRLGLVIDADKFSVAMATYCSNIDKVTAAYECTLLPRESTHCDGDLSGTLNNYITIQNTTMNTYHGMGFSCSNITRSVDCRHKQIEACNKDYANTMTTMMSNLLTPDCRMYNFVSPPNQVTEVTPCIGPYAMDIISRYSEASGIIPDIPGETEQFCRRADPIMNCMEAKMEKSTKLGDVLPRKFASMTNYKKMVHYICSKSELIGLKSACVINHVQRTFYTDLGNNDTCLGRLVIANSNINITDTDTAVKTFCDLVEPAGKCLQPVFEPCGEGIQEVFNTLVMYLSKSCHDPSYVVGSEKQQGQSGAATLGGTVTTIMALTLSSLVVVSSKNLLFHA